MEEALYRLLSQSAKGVSRADTFLIGASRVKRIISFDAELIVSTDQALLQLDGVLANTRGARIRCRDTDSAIELLATVNHV